MNKKLRRRDFLRTAGLAAASVATGRLSRAAGQQGRRPNMVICLADDMSWHDCGCYGNSEVKTPNIDRLADQGMRFRAAFTATAMCAPTRQQLYTGIFPVRNGAFPNHSKVKPGTKSIVHHLKALGYRVGIKGKRHFGPRDSFPFDGVGRTSEFMSKGGKGGGKEPFCLVFTSNNPHLPWSTGDASAYDPKRLTLKPYIVDTPETRAGLAKYYAEITAFDKEVGTLMREVKSAGREADTIFICTSEQGAQFPHGKWTCYDVGLKVAFIVRWPGRVKAGSVSDAMVQYVDVVPTLIEAAGGDPAKIDTGRPGAPDGGSGFDGRSFLAVLDGKTDRHQSCVYGVHTTKGIVAGSACYPIRSIRTETHKYIWNLKSDARFQNITTAGRDKSLYWKTWVEKAKTDPKAAKLVEIYQRRPKEELYDINKDPYELDNLAGDPTNRKLMERLRAKLDAWMRQQGDKGVETELAGRRGGRGGRKKKR